MSLSPEALALIERYSPTAPQASRDDAEHLSRDDIAEMYTAEQLEQGRRLSAHFAEHGWFRAEAPPPPAESPPTTESPPPAEPPTADTSQTGPPEPTPATDPPATDPPPPPTEPTPPEGPAPFEPPKPGVPIEAVRRLKQKGFHTLELEGTLFEADGSFRCTCGDPECANGGSKVGSIGKHPRRKGWQKQTEPDDPERFRPESNAGIRMGNGYVCIDVDVPPWHTDGRPTLADFEKKLGPLPPTVQDVSGGGGPRWFYRVSPDFNARGKLGPGVDVKASGQVVVAPSLHPSGTRYAWKPGHSPFEHEVAELPAAWIEELGKQAKATGTTKPLTGLEGRKPAEVGLLDFAREKLKRHGPAIEGQGGGLHTVQVGAILFRDFALCESDALMLATEWNATCVPPWDPDELETKLANGVEYCDEREIGVWRLYFAMKQVIERVAKKSAASPKGRYQQALADLDAYLDAAEPDDEEIDTFFVPLAEIMKRPRVPTPWIIKGLVPARSIVIIGGLAKSAKSWLALELGMAAATDTPALGEFFTAGKPLAIMATLAEDPLRAVQNRTRSLALSRGRPHEACTQLIHVRAEKGPIDVTRRETLARIIAWARGLPELPSLLIVDPLRDHAGSADENDSGEMSEAMAGLRALRNILGCTVLVVHHEGKPSRDAGDRRGGERLRGSTAIFGAADGLISLTPKEGQEDLLKAEVHVVLRAARGAPAFAMELHLVDDAEGEAEQAKWKFTKLADARQEAATAADLEVEVAVLEAMKGKAAISKEDIRAATGKNRDVVSRVVDRLRDRSLVVEVLQGKRPIGWRLIGGGT